jgi:hypothetical protein
MKNNTLQNRNESEYDKLLQNQQISELLSLHAYAALDQRLLNPIFYQ